jgi:iron complex outermembrane receptor protein
MRAYNNNTGPIVSNQEATFNSVTPRAVARYELTDNSNIYASYSKGFKSGFIATSAPYNKVNPEKLDAFEAGYKYGGGRFRFDTSAYYYDYKDLQVSSLQIVNGTNTAVTANAAKAEIYGVEAQVTGALTDDLNARASVAYNHARFKQFIAAGINIPSPVTGLNSTSCANANPPPATVPCVQNQAGQQLVRAPDWTFNLGADYTHPLEGGAALLASANVAYTSNFATAKSDIGLNGSGLRYGQDGGYALLNLSAGWRAPGEHLTITVYGNNVTNTRYYIYRTGNAFGDYHVLGEPATYGVRADYRF